MKGLAVVTSCNDAYGHYLPEWAASIAAQTSKPDVVAVFTHGGPMSREHVPRVRQIIEGAGIRFVCGFVAVDIDFGAARNAAVRLTDTPWAMHLDADDVLFPFALADAAKLADGADVIGFGYERFGDLKAGPRNLTRTYGNYDGVAALDAAAPCSGVSPFRRSFFDSAPYRLGMLGAWDTALWIGFAQNGARFRATKRPVFGYRQHGDSVFNRRRLIHDWTHYAVVEELKGLRANYGGVTVAIPYKPDGGARDKALEFVKAWYAKHFPDWELRVGLDKTPGKWSKDAATRAALEGARGYVVVIADADCLVDPAALNAAVEAVGNGAPWAMPHTLVHRLTESETAEWYAAGVTRESKPPRGSRTLMRQPYAGYPGGGFVVVRRDRWEAVGGFPTEFVGWGCEDEALAAVLTTLLGDPVRLTADLIHLWHPKGLRVQSAEYYANRERLRAYRAARGNVDAMFALVSPARRKIMAPVAAAPTISTTRLKEPDYISDESGPRKSKTLARTIEIRAEQARRNAEVSSFTDANLAAARARRLADRSPQGEQG